MRLKIQNANANATANAIIVKNVMRFYALGLYSKGNTFSWKMIIGKIFADTMNFTTMPYGGAHGGAEGFWWLRKLKNIHHFHEKPTFLKLQGGRSRWGAWWGAKMEGRMGGRIFAYMVGRWGGASDTCEPICSEKNGIFAMINLINTHPIAPPHTPPHDMTDEILKYNMSTSRGIKNHNFWTNIHVFMATYVCPSDLFLFWASNSSYETSEILP